MGELVRPIGEGAIGGEVYSVAAHAQQLAVGTNATKKVLLFDLTSGDLVCSFGTGGAAKGELDANGCFGLRFTPDGAHLIVAEYHNHRLSKLTLTGDFVRWIGEGTLSHPADVAFTPSGDILVADWEGKRVAVFSSDGSSLSRTFGCRGNAPGQFTGPAALAMQGGQLYVLDENTARVEVFT